ncbi:MAG TPA: T9SS type A sorting domain-containing protein [bacterium]|nr:T9SS type A sorting domain-containing protein [bacterium]
MRKLVILCLAVGLAMASSGQWIGHSPCASSPVRDPQPGIFPSTPTSSTPALFPTSADTLYYDDGTAAQSYYWFAKGNGWGMKFIRPSDNVTLTNALFYTSAMGSSTKVIAKVYADDGAGGSPGTLLATDSGNVTAGQWSAVPINIPIVASNFYIFYVQAVDSAGGLALGIDATNNAPQHRKWSIQSGGFSEDHQAAGDWMIRAAISWTPQAKNAEAMRFATSVIDDTVPNINFTVRATIRNLGTDTLPVGTPVHLNVTGPSSYVFNESAATLAKLAHGGMAQINFSPAWHIPNVPGTYHIKVFTAAAGELFTTNDTMAWDLDCANWLEYVNESKMWWISADGPDKATQFDPAHFGLTYPLSVTRVRAEFYLHPQLPWSDSLFSFIIYGDDGATPLYTSDTLRAPAGTPGSPIALTLSPPVVISSGTFWVDVSSHDGTGHPTLESDSAARGTSQRSWYGSAGSWTQYTSGEWFISAAAGATGIEEKGLDPSLTSPNLQITNYPNPVADHVTLRWQVPSSKPVSVNLYDASGRLVRNLYAANSQSRVGTLNADTRSLPTGIYVVRLETAEGSATRKLVIDR